MGFTGNERVRLVDELSILIFPLELMECQEDSTMRLRCRQHLENCTATRECASSGHFQAALCPRSKIISWEPLTCAMQTVLGEAEELWTLKPISLSLTSALPPSASTEADCMLHDVLFEFERPFIYHEDLGAFWLRPRKWYHILLLPFISFSRFLSFKCLISVSWHSL